MCLVWRWWLTADEDDDGGEVEGDGGMEMAATMVATDEDEGGGDVTAVDGGDDVGCAVEVMAMMVWRVGDDVGGHGGDNDEMVMGMMVAFVGDGGWSRRRWRRSRKFKEERGDNFGG
ncbi:hypothetical protein Tco_1179647 [Tanacetum coccineum]